MTKIIVLAALLAFFLLMPSFETKSLLRSSSYDKISDFQGGSVVCKDCSTADDKTRMKLKSVNIKPPNIQRGQNINFDMEMELLEEVTSGEVIVKLNYGVIPIVDETLDLCDLVTQINTQCPLKKGPFSIKLSENLPGYIPAGKYEGNATISDQNNKHLICLELTVDIS